MNIINLSVALMLLVTSSDLLYLYFAGGWYDPVKWIEWTEVVLLFVLAIGAFIDSVILIRMIFRGGRLEESEPSIISLCLANQRERALDTKVVSDYGKGKQEALKWAG